MPVQVDEITIAKRRLLLRDSLAILTLLAITCVLFVLTLFLFQSFKSHRAELATRWSDRGRRALQANRPEEAIADLRNALTYAPGTRDYELLLAQALAEAGHVDEAYNYFVGLWESQPGDGAINLNLARLSARKGKSADAINYYRAAIYGTWTGDGVTKRAQTRMELARYLIAQRDFQAARTELLIVAGNTPDDFDRDMTLGSLLQESGAEPDAARLYGKAISLRPDDVQALKSTAHLAYAAGDFQTANRLLERAQTALARTHSESQFSPADAELMHNTSRILELMADPYRPRKRVARIITDRTIAHSRFVGCSAQLAKTAASTAWQALAQRWSSPDATVNAPALMRNPERQDAVLRLVYDTEVQAQKLCAAGTADDALLLRLASITYGITQPETEKATSNEKLARTK